MQERDPSWQRSYQVWPFGVCAKIESSDQPIDPKRWGNLTGGFADKWTNMYDGYGATTWEKVANDEMWHAKLVMHSIIVIILLYEINLLY